MIKTFEEFINETRKNPYDAVKELNKKLYMESEGDIDVFHKKLSDYFQQNLNVEQFLKDFENVVFDKVVDIYSEIGDNQIKEFEYDGPYDDSNYAEFAIVFGYNEKDTDGKYYITAFEYEIELTDTEIGKKMINIFNEVLEDAYKEYEYRLQQEEDWENTKSMLNHQNGWGDY